VHIFQYVAASCVVHQKTAISLRDCGQRQSCARICDLVTIVPFNGSRSPVTVSEMHGVKPR
jgi:hypothetical protein